MKRILTAALLIPLAVYVVLWADPLLFLGVLAGAAFLSYREYNSLAAGYGFGAPGPLGYLAGVLLLLGLGEAWLVLTATALAGLAWAMRAEPLSKALPRASLLLLGVAYIFGCWHAALLLHEINRRWLLFALLVSWAGDIGAYYVGGSFGRHKMAPRVSPSKSWEGSAASVITSVLLAGGYLAYFVPGIPAPRAIAVTALANVAGQIGDLAESAIKRGAGTKDSGALLPGHGGFLDRVDSTLFALPVVYACFARWAA
jgi:phosphatidate cytidylyltransferase